MDLSVLKKLGLSDKEAKVYLTLLEYGALSVRAVAEMSGLNRGTSYDILKSLQESGLVSYYQAESKQKFVAESPDKLLDLLDRQEEDLRGSRARLSELVPELKSLQEKDGDRPTSKLYEGQSGVRSILDDVLATMKDSDDKEYYVYSAAEVSDDLNKAFPDFTKRRIKLNIAVRAISLSSGGRTYGLDERRWLATDDKSATFVVIYNGRCAFISRDARGVPVGVIIENEDIYRTQKTIFLELWRSLSA